MTLHRLEIEARRGLGDPLAEATRRRLDTWLQLHPRALATRRVYHLELGLDQQEAARVLAALVDPVAEVGALGMLEDPEHEGELPWVLSIGSLPGVTDAVGRSVARAAADCVGRPLVGNVYTSILYLVWGLEREAIERAAKQLLYNPLIQRMKLEPAPRALDLTVPRAGSSAPAEVRTVSLRSADDATLEAISRDGTLALTLLEMRAIQDHFWPASEQLGRDPTDAELECLAQTWSEHCKHKIFASPIHYTDPDGAERVLERGLFSGYVRAATQTIAARRLEQGLDPVGEDFLVSVFHDNAGVVRFTESDHLVYKVETHNSPSALDPYGGAMTGIVGVNRDSFGTGLGADLLTNVWGYCFGDPRGDHAELPAGLMHPRRIRDGVHEGVIDGGNQSGIPYSRGFELFDPRYTGKPLVYCGTVAVMPVSVPGPDGAPRPTHEKPIAVGDNIVMVGGRIGKDGIHGATFSSVELDEQSPVQAVQIGDPITQKMMWDFLTEARDRGLYSGMTDNGAGGLSSSVGELAEATGGARIDLAAAPLKYPGLAPWEILISEAQERMSVAVPASELEAFVELARRREVEVAVLGVFTDTGRFEVTYGQTSVCDLGLEFLHGGVPLPTLEARWSPPERPPSDPAGALAQLERLDLRATILELLARPNLAANDDRARHYDHEVKGLSVIKPLLGVRGDVPSTATVMRVRHGRDEGVVLGEAVHPWYSDFDTDAMAKACVDEGVRRVLCAGARIDRIAALDNFCWPDPIRSAKTPDGEHKLAQLVRCCEGLYAACVAYGVPLISGKDSMKNDAFLGGVKISIPPTLLVSVIGQTTDVARSLSLEPRGADDELRVYLLGPTALEFDGSELARALADRDLLLAGTDVPRTDLERSWARYQAFVEQRDAGRVRSAHVCGRGGLAVALVHMVLAGEHTLDLDLDALLGSSRLPAAAALLSESTGRIVLTCTNADAPALEQALTPHGLVALGQVMGQGSGAQPPGLVLRQTGQPPLTLALAQLRAQFEEGLHGI